MKSAVPTAAQSPADYEPLLTEYKVCEWLGVVPSTLARWRKEGSGPKFIVLGPKRFAYHPEEIRRWMAGRTFPQGDASTIYKEVIAPTESATSEVTGDAGVAA